MLPNIVKVREYPTAIASGVTVDEVKVHLGIFGDNSLDSYLGNLIVAAEDAASSYIGQSIGLILKEAVWLNMEPSLTLPDKYIVGTPVLMYYNESGTATVVDTALYTIDSTGMLTVLRLNDLMEYPTDQSKTLQYPVFIEYESGFEAEQISSVLIQALMMYCKEMYENRGISTDKSVNKLPLSAERLLSSYRGGYL